MQTQELLDYTSTSLRMGESVRSILGKLLGRNVYVKQENVPVSESVSYLLIEVKEYSADAHVCLRRDAQRIILEYLQTQGRFEENVARELGYKGAMFVVDTNIIDSVIMGRRPDGAIIFDDPTTSTTHCTLSWKPQVIRAFANHLDLECSSWNLLMDRNPGVNYQDPTEEQQKPWKTRIFAVTDSSLNGTYVERREGIERIHKSEMKEVSFSEEIIIGMPIQREGIKAYTAKVALTLISGRSPIMRLLTIMQNAWNELNKDKSHIMNMGGNMGGSNSSISMNPLDRIGLPRRASIEQRPPIQRRSTFLTSPGDRGGGHLGSAGPYGSVDGSSVDGRSMYRGAGTSGVGYIGQSATSSAVARLSNSMQRLKEEKERLEKELDTTLHHLDALEADKRQMKGQLEEMRVLGTNQNKDFHIVQSSLTSVQEEAHRYRQALSELQKVKEGLQETLNDSKAIQASQGESIIELKKTNGELQSSLQKSRDELATLKEKLSKWDSESALLLQQERHDKQIIVDELNDKLRVTNSTIVNLQKEITTNELRYNQTKEYLESTLETSQNEVRKYNQMLECSNQDIKLLRKEYNAVSNASEALMDAKEEIEKLKTTIEREKERHTILLESNEDLLERIAKSEQEMANLEHRLRQWPGCMVSFSEEIVTFVKERGDEIYREMENGEYGVNPQPMPTSASRYYHSVTPDPLDQIERPKISSETNSRDEQCMLPGRLLTGDQVDYDNQMPASQHAGETGMLDCKSDGGETVADCKSDATEVFISEKKPGKSGATEVPNAVPNAARPSLPGKGQMVEDEGLSYIGVQSQLYPGAKRPKVEIKEDSGTPGAYVQATQTTQQVSNDDPIRQNSAGNTSSNNVTSSQSTSNIIGGLDHQPINPSSQHLTHANTEITSMQPPLAQVTEVFNIGTPHQPTTSGNNSSAHLGDGLDIRGSLISSHIDDFGIPPTDERSINDVHKEPESPSGPAPLPKNTAFEKENDPRIENENNFIQTPILLNDVVAKHRGWPDSMASMGFDCSMGLRYSIEDDDIDPTQ